MLQLREFNHNHHPSRVKILAENIRRGISVKNGLYPNEWGVDDKIWDGWKNME